MAQRWDLGARVLYVVWGLLHMGLGASMVIGGLSDGAPVGELESESLMFFICITTFGAQAVFVAVAMGGRGYWLNTVVLGVVDVAFLVFLVFPGHVDLVGGVSGPVVWLLGTVCATVARVRGSGEGRVAA